MLPAGVSLEKEFTRAERRTERLVWKPEFFCASARQVESSFHRNQLADDSQWVPLGALSPEAMVELADANGSDYIDPAFLPPAGFIRASRSVMRLG